MGRQSAYPASPIVTTTSRICPKGLCELIIWMAPGGLVVRPPIPVATPSASIPTRLYTAPLVAYPNRASRSTQGLTLCSAASCLAPFVSRLATCLVSFMRCSAFCLASSPAGGMPWPLLLSISKPTKGYYVLPYSTWRSHASCVARIGCFLLHSRRLTAR